MRLIVGLGNPGSEYHRTRHNAGFMALDRLVGRNGLNPADARARFHGRLLEGTIASQRCLLLWPLTFMNRSGAAVAEARGFYKLEASDLMVLVDDLALPTGRIRLRGEGSAGGHNGLADIQRALGTHAYPRLRIGIDAPFPPGIVQADYVLGRFTPDQLSRLEPALDDACAAVEHWIAHGLDKTMTRFNARE